MNVSDIRSELFSSLLSLSERAPQMRVGQLMAALGELSADRHGRGLWDIGDDDFLEVIWHFRRGIEHANLPMLEQEAQAV